MSKYSTTRLSFLAGLLLVLSIFSDSASIGFVFGVVWGVISTMSHVSETLQETSHYKIEQENTHE